jgi:hypothetical protein
MEKKQRFLHEDLARKFTKGLRCKFRTYIRKIGFKEKFELFEMRGKILLVLLKDWNHVFPKNITEFEGHKVQVGFTNDSKYRRIYDLY